MIGRWFGNGAMVALALGTALVDPGRAVAGQSLAAMKTVGGEWDAALGVAVDKKPSFLAKYANSDGEGTFRDKSIFWFQVEYKL